MQAELAAARAFNSFWDATGAAAAVALTLLLALSIPFRRLRYSILYSVVVLSALFQFLLGCYLRVLK